MNQQNELQALSNARAGGKEKKKLFPNAVKMHIGTSNKRITLASGENIPYIVKDSIKIESESPYIEKGIAIVTFSVFAHLKDLPAESEGKI